MDLALNVPAGQIQSFKSCSIALPWVDLLIALLKVDQLAARQLYESHRRSGISPKHRRTMLRRIRAEKLTEIAKAARIDLDLRLRRRSA